MQIAIAALCAFFLSVGAASAQPAAFPNKPVTMVVGWAPGGIVDVVGRLLASKLTEMWGQQVLIDNRPGATGAIGNGIAARATPDGYTLAMVSSPEVTVIGYQTATSPKYFEGQLKPVLLVSSSPMALVGQPTGPIQSVADLVSEAKAHPGHVSYSSAGVGSINQLAGETFSRAANIKLKHIPYKGGAPAAVAVASGETNVGMLVLGPAMSLVNAGKIKVLGVASATRIPPYLNYPTIAEQGFSGFQIGMWTAVFAPEKTPDAVLKKIEADCRKVLADPEVVKQLEALGAAPGTAVTVSQFEQQIKSEIETNKKILQTINAKSQ